MHKAGFTLIELLIVVLIVGILAAFALPEYHKAVERSRMSEALAIMEAVSTSQLARYMEMGSYASRFSALDVAPEGVFGAVYYTKGDATTGAGGNGFGVELHSAPSEGYVLAVRYKEGQPLRYNYTLKRMYGQEHVTCISSEEQGQVLCADFCGIETPVVSCCNDGSSGECPSIH